MAQARKRATLHRHKRVAVGTTGAAGPLAPPLGVAVAAASLPGVRRATYCTFDRVLRKGREMNLKWHLITSQGAGGGQV